MPDARRSSAITSFAPSRPPTTSLLYHLIYTKDLSGISQGETSGADSSHNRQEGRETVAVSCDLGRTSGVNCSRSCREGRETVAVSRDLGDNLPNHEEGPRGLGGTAIPLEVDVVLPRPYSGTSVDSEISNLHTGHCDFSLFLDEVLF